VAEKINEKNLAIERQKQKDMEELKAMQDQSSDVLSNINNENAVAKMVSKYNE
jgi:hypothetical protein